MQGLSPPKPTFSDKELGPLQRAAAEAAKSEHKRLWDAPQTTEAGLDSGLRAIRGERGSVEPDPTSAKPPVSPTQAKKPHGNSKVDLDDFIVFAVCELFAIPMCDAGWHAVVANDHLTRGLVAVMVGAPLGLLGAGYHWLKQFFSGDVRQNIKKFAWNWWPAALVLAFIYITGPEIYDRATKLAPSPAQSTSPQAPPSAPKPSSASSRDAPKPHYTGEDIEIMLRALRLMQQAHDTQCAAAYTAVNRLLNGWRQILPNALALSEGAASAATLVNDCQNAIGNPVNANQYYQDILRPITKENSDAFGDLLAPLEQLSRIAGELAKGRTDGMNLEMFIQPVIQNFDPGYAKFGKWMGSSQKNISDKTKELREWRND
jgi:hypothetical protein